MQSNSILNTQRYYRLVGLMNKNKYYQSDMFDLIINQIKYLTNPPNYDLRESYINNNPFNIDIFTNETMIVDYRLNADNKQIAKLKRELNEDIITDRDVDLDVFKFIIDLDIKPDYVIDYDNTMNNIGLMYQEIINYLNDYFKDKINKQENNSFSVIDDQYVKYVNKYSDTFNYLDYVYSVKVFDIDNVNASNVHLIYPYLFVNKIQYRIIINDLINHMLSLNGIFKMIKWDKLIDCSMANNGLRLLFVNKPLKKRFYDRKTKQTKFEYFKKEITTYKPNYYVIDKRSTLKFNDKDLKHQLIITSMQCNLKCPNININYENIIENVINKQENIIRSNKPPKITSINHITNEHKKQSIPLTNNEINTETKKLFYLLSPEYYSSYCNWFRFVCICHTYGWLNFCKDFSKNYCLGWDNNSEYIIDNIFSSNSNKQIKINTLFYEIFKYYETDENGNKKNHHSILKDIVNINVDCNKLEEELKSIGAKSLITNIKTNKLVITKSEDVEDNEYHFESVNHEFIDDNDIELMSNYNNIFINSCVGTGKTTTIIKLITKWSKEHLEMLDKRYPNLKYLNKKDCEFVKSLLNDNSDEDINDTINLLCNFNNDPYIYSIFNVRILIISSLITLGDKIFKDLNDNGIKIFNYRTNSNSDLLNNQHNLIISLEQLYKLRGSYDIVIIDEFTSFIGRFNSHTNKENRIKNLNKLFNLCANSNHIILCDAILRDDSYYFSKILFNKRNSLYFMNSFKKCQDKTVTIYKAKNNENITNTFIDSFIDDKIKSRESIIICSDSAKKAEEIFSYVKTKNIPDDYALLITKNYYDQDIMIDYNKTFKNKCVIFSPKILYGIDIQIPYESIYAVYTGKSINSYLMLQQISRCRKCKEIKILALFDDKNNKVISYDLYKNKYIKYVIKHNISLEKILDKDFPYDKLKYEQLNIKSPMLNEVKYINVVLQSLYYEYITRSNKLHCLKLLCEYQGYKIDKGDFYDNSLNIENNQNDQLLKTKITEEIKQEIKQEIFESNLEKLKLDSLYYSIKDKKTKKALETKLFIDELCSANGYSKYQRSKILFTNNEELDEYVKSKVNEKDNIINIVIDPKHIELRCLNVINDYCKIFNCKIFKLLSKYQRIKIKTFIEEHKNDINIISESSAKDSLKYCNLIINTNIKDKNIGLHYFNNFIVFCYGKINCDLIKYEKVHIRYHTDNNDEELRTLGIFNLDYINKIIKILHSKK